MYTRFALVDANDPDERYAHIACYLRDSAAGKVYAVTNKHVALFANSGVYIKPGRKVKQILGYPVPSTEDDSQDIALVEVTPDCTSRVSNEVTDQQGKTRKLTLYKGDFYAMCGQEVVKCNSYAYARNESPSDVFGIVSSAEYQREMFEDDTGQFCIDDKAGVFSRQGDSGKAVALKTKDDADCIEVIGMIIGRNNSHTVCIFLPDVLDEIRDEFDMDLEFLESENRTETQIDRKKSYLTDQQIIESCVMIFLHYKTPEQVSPYSFDLVQYVLRLAGIRFDEFLMDSNFDILEYEKELKRLVNKRKTLECYPVFENDTPEYQALEQGLKAVECLHSENFVEVEIKLKTAIKCIPKCQNVGIRMFSKNYTYVMWYYILQNNDEARGNLKKLIEEGFEFYDDNLTCKGFPKETGGYLYYEFSRYYLQQYDTLRGQSVRDMSEELKTRSLAIEKARSAVRIMEEVHTVENTPHSLARQSYIKCELAFALLGCGNNFDVTGERFHISEEDLYEADHLLGCVTRDAVKTSILVEHAVKYNIYLTALCDLYFRKGYYKRAFDVAGKCYIVASEKIDKWGVRRSKRRKDVLSNLYLF